MTLSKVVPISECMHMQETRSTWVPSYIILQETALRCGKSGFLTGQLPSSSYRNPTQHLLTNCALMPPTSKLCFNSMVASFGPNISTQFSSTYHALKRTDSDNTDCGIATQIFIVTVMSSTLWASAIILGIGSLLMFSGANFNTLNPRTLSYIYQGVRFIIIIFLYFELQEFREYYRLVNNHMAD